MSVVVDSGEEQDQQADQSAGRNPETDQDPPDGRLSVNAGFDPDRSGRAGAPGGAPVAQCTLFRSLASSSAPAKLKFKSLKE